MIKTDIFSHIHMTEREQGERQSLIILLCSRLSAAVLSHMLYCKCRVSVCMSLTTRGLPVLT